jgi:tagatose 6-phosphate kinase
VIVTVTLNPALHVGYQTERVRLGGVNPVSQVSYRAGGRGLAVARVLHTFGHDVVATGLAGGASGEMIRAELARAGVATQFTWISGESRRVVEVSGGGGPGGGGPGGGGPGEGGPGGGGPGGQSSAITTFCEPAPYITTEELGRLAADYRSLMADATAAVLSGSLPAGLPAETYGSLATYAAEAGVPVVLDAGGSALWHGASRRPALVIPDLPRGRGTTIAPDGVDLAAEPKALDPDGLVAGGVGGVVILSDHAVVVVTAQGEWRAELPGELGPGGESDPGLSRDALLAGFVPGIALGWSWPDMIRHAVALAAAAQVTGEVELEAYEALVPEVRVDPGR